MIMLIFAFMPPLHIVVSIVVHYTPSCSTRCLRKVEPRCRGRRRYRSTNFDEWDVVQRWTWDQCMSNRHTGDFLSSKAP